MNVDFGINLLPQLKQRLELKIDQRLINKLNLLRMPYQKLLERIKEEIENNIVLKAVGNDSFIERVKDKYFSSNIKELADRKDKQIESLSLEIKPTLEEHLLNQLSLRIIDDIEKKIGEELISSVDKDGYIRNYQTVRNNIKEKLHVRNVKADKILKIIQSFEPLGVAARDLKECLLIQINEDSIKDKAFKLSLNKLIQNYSEYIERGDTDLIKREMNISDEFYKALILYLKGLDPFPGRQFMKSKNPEIVYPSFEIKEDGNSFKVVNLEEDFGPELKIKEKYLKMLDDPKLDEATRNFIKGKIKEAKTLIEDIRNRKFIIEKLLLIIIKKQDSFLKSGISWLKPFQQDEAAVELKVHPSTVSRAVRGKYVQTPQGLFPLSFLLPRNQKGFSSQQIKRVIQGVIFSNKGEKLSDKNITDILNKEGIDIRRRTVAKYRHELNLSPSI